MVCSMTGYGRCEVANEKNKFTVEMKSVNNRYLDINIKMPKKINALESKIRGELKKYIKRGKVDVFITYEDFSESDSRVKYNKEIAEEYLGYLKQMAEDFGIDNDVRVSSLSKYPDVFSMEDTELDEEERRQAEGEGRAEVRGGRSQSEDAAEVRDQDEGEQRADLDVREGGRRRQRPVACGGPLRRGDRPSPAAAWLLPLPLRSSPRSADPRTHPAAWDSD